MIFINTNIIIILKSSSSSSSNNNSGMFVIIIINYTPANGRKHSSNCLIPRIRGDSRLHERRFGMLTLQKSEIYVYICMYMLDHGYVGPWASSGCVKSYTTQTSQPRKEFPTDWTGGHGGASSNNLRAYPVCLPARRLGDYARIQGSLARNCSSLPSRCLQDGYI